MTIKKLNKLQIEKYRKAYKTKKIVPDVITVDENGMKNLQARIPIELWIDVKVRAARELVSTNKFVETAINTYLALDDEDFDYLNAKITKALEEIDAKERELHKV